MLKLKDILNGKEYSYIEFHIHFRGVNGKERDYFAGCCQYKNGNLISLDNDSYSLEDECDGSKEWITEKDFCVHSKKGNSHIAVPIKRGDLCLVVWKNMEGTKE